MIGPGGIWRGLVVAAVAAAVLAPAGAAATTVGLAYVDATADRVGTGPRATPDGRADGHFRLTVNGNDTIRRIELRTADAAGTPCCGQVWNTVPNDPWWILGVFRNGRQLNPVDTNISDRIAGSATYDLYGANSGFFRVGQRFVVFVNFASGSCLSALTTIGGASTAAGRCAATAPAPPPAGSATGTVLVNGAAFSRGPIPFGSIIDVTRGRLTLTTDLGTLAVYGDGTHPAAFKLTRTSERINGKKRPLVQLTLVGGDFGACRARSLAARPLASGRAKPKVVRALWGSGRGRFRTKGRYAAATVRGTIWLTADRCDGTLVQAKRGTLAVRDFTRRRTVRVRAGTTYVAPARR